MQGGDCAKLFCFPAPQSFNGKPSVYTRITAEIIAAIEAGAGEFKMPWHHTGTSIARPTNIASNKRYRGVNVLALWVAAKIARYDSGIWAPIGSGKRSKPRYARASAARP